MFKDTIDNSPRNSEKISQKLEQVTFNSIRKVLPDRLIMEACKSIGYTYRERKMTPIVPVLHMIMAAIWPEESFNASWQVIWAHVASWFPSLSGQCPARTNVARARARLPVQLWHKLFDGISLQSQRLSEQYDKWKGHRVVLADGTCVSMSAKPELFEAFGTNDGYHGKGKKKGHIFFYNLFLLAPKQVAVLILFDRITELTGLFLRLIPLSRARRIKGVRFIVW